MNFFDLGPQEDVTTPKPTPDVSATVLRLNRTRALKVAAESLAKPGWCPPTRMPGSADAEMPAV